MDRRKLTEAAERMCRYVSGQPSGKEFSTCTLLEECYPGVQIEESEYFQHLAELDRMFWKKVKKGRIACPDFEEYLSYRGEIPQIGLAYNIPYRCWKPGDGIQTARVRDLDEITQLESLCFPAAEAAGRSAFSWRLRTYRKYFLILRIDGKIVSFVNGPVTQEADLTDGMYASPSFHNENGNWQMISGLVTHPAFQKRGYGSYLLKQFIRNSASAGRKGVVLTCKEKKIPFYSKFGFHDEGLSSSTHGGVPWHQMRLVF